RTVGSQSGVAVRLQTQPNGTFKIVLAGTNYQPDGTLNFLAARFNPNGTADAGFGSGGSGLTHVGGSDQFGGRAVQGDGKVVVAGFDSSAATPEVYVVRYTADGAPDTDFGPAGTGAVVIAPPAGYGTGPGGSRGSYGAAVQSDGQILVGGTL